MVEVLLFTFFVGGIGLLFVFFGYPLFRLLLPLWGFIAGLMFGVNGMDSLMGSGFFSVGLGLIIGFVLGLILAAVAYFAYQLAVIIWGASMGYVLGSGLMLAIGFSNGFFPWLVGVVVAIAMIGLFTQAKMPRLVVMFFTAAGGSMAVLTALFALFGQVPTAAASLQLTRFMVWGSWFWLLLWAIVAGIGLAFQYALSRQEDLMTAYEWEQLMQAPTATK